MGEAWFTGVADELARCLLDAENCAEACEALLESVRALPDPAVQRRVRDAVIAPAAVARVLIELIDHPPGLVLAAARLCGDSAGDAARRLDELDGGGRAAERAAGALRTCAESCGRLLDAAV